MAVGFNGKVLVTTIGTGTGAEVLITYDPVTGKTQPVSVAPPAPVAPTLPPPNGIMYLAGKSRLQTSQDGKLIIGVNLQAATRTVFVFDVASSIVLGSRVVPVISPTLAVSPDGSKFLSGPMLFDTADAGGAGAAEHHQLALRLSGHRQLQRADQSGRGRLPAGQIRPSWRPTISCPPPYPPRLRIPAR